MTDRNEFDMAKDQLGAALGALEHEIEGLLERLAAHRPVELEAEALRKDRARLASDLDRARSRERELQQLADEASHALGEAIKEVQDALGKV